VLIKFAPPDNLAHDQNGFSPSEMATDLSLTADAVLERQLLSDRELELPLVTLVVVNRDYATYVGKTIHSIRCQSYSAFECIVVDNASTDDSLVVIERAIADDRRFTIVKFDENLGQLLAIIRIFDRIRGSFVVVVDADDLLFPEFISSHVQVHLALPSAVSLTSSDIVEIDAQDRVLNGSRQGFAADCESEPRGLRPHSAAIRLTTISEADYQRLSEATVTMPHWKLRWVWAPGTANMFRKSVLDLALPDVSRIQGHIGFDSYFCAILHLMTGSALVGRSLSAYRLHGRNVFSSSPSMKALHTYRKLGSAQWLLVLHTLLSRAETFDFVLAGDRLWSTIDLLPAIQRMSPRAYFAHSAVQDVLAENLNALIGIRGAPTVLSELYERLEAASIWRVIRKAYANGMPLSLRWTLVKESARHIRQSLRAERLYEVIEEQRNSNPLSVQEDLPAIFKPGVEANRRANASGIWNDGWCAARCELCLPGGDQRTISIEGTVPNVIRGFRSKLVVRVDGDQIGTLYLEPGDISAAWQIPETSIPRAVMLEFDSVQALKHPDTRKAAMLIREIAVRPGVKFEQNVIVPLDEMSLAPVLYAVGRLARKLFGLAPVSGKQRLHPPIITPTIASATDSTPTLAAEVLTADPEIETGALSDGDRVAAWRADLIDETIHWANARRPMPKLCNICGYSGYFRAHWFPVMPEVKCPQCLSLERHRLLKLWFDDHASSFAEARVLHFAAEAAVTRFIKPTCREYLTADLAPGRADIVLNIEMIDLPDSRFDIVVCSHVLEHVDDRRGLAELYRVLSPAGFALLMFPLVEGWTTTYEDSSKTDEEERWQHFCQGDHVRRYGADVRQRIVDVGFTLREFTAVEPYVTRHGLLAGEKLFVARKSLVKT
jgi:hypothetical protein